MDNLTFGFIKSPAVKVKLVRFILDTLRYDFGLKVHAQRIVQLSPKQVFRFCLLRKGEIAVAGEQLCMFLDNGDSWQSNGADFQQVGSQLVVDTFADLSIALILNGRDAVQSLAKAADDLQSFGDGYEEELLETEETKSLLGFRFPFTNRFFYAAPSHERVIQDVLMFFS